MLLPPCFAAPRVREPHPSPSSASRLVPRRACATALPPVVDELEDIDVAQAAAAYRSEGWVLLPGVVELRDVAALNDAADGLERLGAALEASQRLNGVFFEVQSSSGRKGEPAVWPGALRKLTGPSRRSRAFAQLAAHDRLTRLVASVCGVRCPTAVVDQVNTKLPRVGTGYPWRVVRGRESHRFRVSRCCGVYLNTRPLRRHQDASFLFGHAAAALRAHGGANAVVALDDSDASCGGLELLGRTHASAPLVDLRGRYDTADDADGLNASFFDVSRRVCPAMKPGDVLLFHPLLAHGSGPNASARRRRLATLWFVGSPGGGK